MRGNLIREIHRRSLWQVLGIYLGGSWIALQVVETLSESMSLPQWVQGFSVILLILGLPVVLATAFVQEGVGRRASSAPATQEPDTDTAGSRPKQGEDTAPGAPAPASADTPAAFAGARASRGGQGLFTWRRAIFGGVGAFALLGVAMTGWVVLRSLGIGPAGTLVAKGLLEERATLLLTDFVAADRALSRAATEAIRVDLDQSNVIDIADPGFVTAALARMEREPGALLDATVGRELAEREGMPAIITGEITQAGTGHVLTAQIVTTAGGEVLVSDRESAKDDSELVPAIDRLSRKLRERIGESLGDLAATPSLERVTTSDLDALRGYSRAILLSDRGDQQEAADLLEETVQRDTGFAMAWRKLGMLHVSGGGALGNFSRGVEALDRAYRFRDRLTERERLLATAGYYGYVVKDARREADAYERMLENDPDDPWALNNLALVLEADLDDFERAERLLRRTLELVDSATSTPHWNLSVLQGRLGRYDDALATLDSWRTHVAGDPRPYLFGANLAAARRDFEGAAELAREAVLIRPGSQVDAAFSSSIIARLAAVRGRESEALEILEASERAQPGPGNALREALAPAYFTLEARSDPEKAARDLDAALARHPLDEMGPLDPPWSQLVELEARTRGVEPARTMLARWEAADPNASTRRVHVVALAWIEIAEGRPEAAARRLAGVDDWDCADCALRARSVAWGLTGPPDSALVHGERYVEMGDMFRIYADASFLAPQLERLGRGYDELGDLEKAANYYAQFVELWAEADESLQPRVRAAQARLEEILKTRG